MIRMQANFNEILKSQAIQYVIGNDRIVCDMRNVKPMQPFSDRVVSFLNDLSKLLLKTGKAYSDVVTFAFWCRKAAVLTEKVKYDDLSERIGKGVVFHSTPSNVPVNFAFSFATGFLAGNANIVRLPAKQFAQVSVICTAIAELLQKEYSDLQPYIAMVKYGMVQEVSDCFSSVCDTRVVWGGDNTVMGMRMSPLKPRANEITFADRHSLAVIDIDAYDRAENKTALAQAFYNDTYFSDQNACTSPRLIVWYAKNYDAEKAERVKNGFWSELHALVKEQYTMAPVQAVGKLAALYKVACRHNVRKVGDYTDNYITRVRLNGVDETIMSYKYNSGFFFELDTSDLRDILPCCMEACQTLSYYGLDIRYLHDIIMDMAPRGIDRIVPIGKTMDFTLIWDGHDLIREMSRRINCI